MTFNSKARRRWLGAVCLVTALVMLVTGETAPGERLKGVAFVIYWLACFLFAALAMLAAILDARALRREARAEQRALWEDTLDAMRKGKTSGSNSSQPK